MNDTAFKPFSKNVKDLTGQKFGRLTVLGFVGVTEKGSYAQWLCRCECGAETVKRACNLTNGSSRSCGCLLMEKATKHGRSYTKMYSLWQSMRSRCQPYSPAAAHYFDRGIKVCEKWDTSLETFIADVGEPPSKRHSLDRIDNNGDYEPGNVRWATASQQANNKTNNHPLTYQGKTLSISQWATELGVDRVLIKDRLRRGWTVEDALTKPIRLRANKG